MFGNDDKKDDDNNQDNQPVTTDPPVDLGSSSSDQPSDSGVPSSSDDIVPSSSPPLNTVGGESDELLTIKQGALQHLSPLVDHLDQSPEEKFKTTMMMIQAADDQSLVKTAYDIALEITDEKAKAQALLDVVNEINYFTQKHHEDS